MAPRQRKALGDINVNALKTQNQKLSSENDALKEQLADLTSTLSKMSITEKKPAEVAPLPIVMPTVRVPHPPKRAVSAYSYFVKQARKERAEELNGVSMKDSSGIVAKWWKDLKDADRKPFVDMAMKDKARYEVEFEAFKRIKEDAEREKKALDMYAEQQKSQAALAVYEHLMNGGKVDNMPVVKNVSPVVEKPKGPRSAYNLFVAQRRADIVAKNAKSGDKTVVTTKELAEEWNTLLNSKAKKNKTLVEKYRKLAVEDKERAMKEMAEYEQELEKVNEEKRVQMEETRNEAMANYEKIEKEAQVVKEAEKLRKLEAEREKELRKKERDEKRKEREAKKAMPTRARSAYMFYCAENRKAVVDSSKEKLSNAEVMKQLGAKWKALSARGKAKYEKLAKEDKVRYTNEMAALQK